VQLAMNAFSVLSALLGLNRAGRILYTSLFVLAVPARPMNSSFTRRAMGTVRAWGGENLRLAFAGKRINQLAALGPVHGRVGTLDKGTG